MRQLKNKFRRNKEEHKTKRRIKNRMFPVLLSLLVVSLTCVSTQAYFNNKASFSQILGSLGSDDSLAVTNGDVKLSFSDDSKWVSTNSSSITRGGDGTYIFSDVSAGSEFKYGPVELESVSNLTTNIDLGIDFGFTAKQTSDGETGGSDIGYGEISDNFVTGFEVIVGDMDNFGYGFARNKNIGINAYTDFQNATELSTTQFYDVYNDWNNPDTSLRMFDRKFGTGEAYPYSTNYSRKYNGMEIFPSSNYDAIGTDRRMVNSGFYDYMLGKGLIRKNEEADFSKVSEYGVAFGYNYINDKGDDTGSTFSFDTNKIGKYYVNGASYYWMFISNDNVRATYDGLTERALKGYYGAWYSGQEVLPTKAEFQKASDSTTTTYWGNWIGLSSRNWADEKNWQYIQKVEPLTFKYADIPSDGKIASLCIQIYIDDIQPKHEGYSDKSSFSYVSQNKYKLEISGDNGNSWDEISTWSEVINNLSQSGPAGEMITLNMSDVTESEKAKIISALKAGGGLEKNGLKLKIDDTTTKRSIPSEYQKKFAMGNNSYTVSGDSYSIDFAKMTVNGNIDATQETIKITGTVKDAEGNPLSDVTVSTSNSARTSTDSNGNFEIKAIKENKDIDVTFIKDGYKSTYSTINFNRNSIINITLAKKADASKEKVDISIIVDEYATNISNNSLSNTVISDITDNEKALASGKGIEIIQTKEQVNIDENGNKVSSGGTNVIRTTRTYKNINIDEIEMQLAQCSMAVEPGRIYKIYYSIKIQDSSMGLCTYKFNSSLKARSTQENNQGWNVLGDEKEKYSSKITVLGNVLSFKTTDDTQNPGTENPGEGEGSGSIIEETSENILKNNTPGIYFQNDGKWDSADIFLNNSSISTEKFSNTNWIKGSPNELVPLNKGSTILVKGNNASSGNLYYFNTKKVFICNTGADKSNKNLKIHIDSSNLGKNFSNWWNRIYYYYGEGNNQTVCSNTWPGDYLGGFGVKTIELSSFGSDINNRYIILVNGNKDSEKTTNIKIPDGAVEAYINNEPRVYKYIDKNGNTINN
ncbi:MAG: carboxypeptidase regulatory-like domain-containing protein [Clostridium sp.]|nr:carboxypeptidase regulatory-like domain-containing protein [Clostridium sp.]